jgi:hypothetical protein
MCALQSENVNDFYKHGKNAVDEVFNSIAKILNESHN